MADANAETLRSYGERIREYVDGTAPEVTGAAKDWIDAALSGLPLEARLLELGSAFGRDAAYIAAKGYAIRCTDAVPGFVTHLRERGMDAHRFNALTDALDGRFDLILANAVLLHFDRDQFAAVLRRMIGALVPGGRFAFSLKRGRGESWSEAKIGAPRFFCYWEPDQVAAALSAAGYRRWTLDAAHTGRAHADWLFVIAHASPPAAGEPGA